MKILIFRLMKILDALKDRFRRGPLVTVLRLEGVISPRPRRGVVSLAGYAAAIDRAFSLRRLAAVALVINSPGGSPVQSALLYRRIRQLAEEKSVPVFAFAEDVAASGGYWLLLAGDEIYGEEASILGSIGVISAGFGFAGLINRFGVERRVHTAGERKSLLDPFLPENPADVERLSTLQQDIHAIFKEHVVRRRAGKIDAGDEGLFSGDILTGRMALARGLIDGIGEVRGVMRARFGEDVRLRTVAAERRRRLWWPRLPLVARRGFEPVADLLEWVEARLVWARFGL
ncbi:MAG TPA: S49 family peptidase [Stellaceae bacterium]|nr:S49 family peptidase [Stellaceae bacterium]